MRNVECGMRNCGERSSAKRRSSPHSAFRIPHSALCSLALLTLATPRSLPGQQWPVHSMDRPRPPVVDPGPERPPVAPPSDAIVLFDGKNLDQWQTESGAPAKWVVRDGYLEVAPRTGAIQTKRGFGDVQLHVEWAAPAAVRGNSQNRGNSGIFLQDIYEVQVLDNFENKTYVNGMVGSIYKQYPPLVNAAYPAEHWQTYDIIFTAPRFNADGSLLSAARLTVLLNGVLVQNNSVLKGGTTYIGQPSYHPHGDMPIRLQDHGHLVRYRNIWVRKL